MEDDILTMKSYKSDKKNAKTELMLILVQPFYRDVVTNTDMRLNLYIIYIYVYLGIPGQQRNWRVEVELRAARKPLRTNHTKL